MTYFCSTISTHHRAHSFDFSPITSAILYKCGRGLHLDHLVAALLGMNDHPLDPMDQFERTFTTILQRLRRFAPAAIEECVGGRDTGGRRCILAAHDADENTDCSASMTACERSNFNESLGHARFLASLIWMAVLRSRRSKRRQLPAPQRGRQSSENPSAHPRIRAAG